MQEIGVRGPASAAGLLHHHRVHHHHHHVVHHQLSSADADVNTSDNETSTVERHSSGEEEGSTSSCHSPIDLSSGATPTGEASMIAAPPPAAQTAPSATTAMTAGMESSHQAAAAFLTARKFAQFLQQHQQQQQKELNETTPPASTPSLESPLVCPKKRARPEIRESFGDDEDGVDDDDDEGVTKLDVEDEAKQSLMPLELIRARWTGAESPSAESAGGSSVGSSGHTEATGLGREVKKRRLDELLSKKFSVADSPPNSSSAASSSISPPPIVTSSTQQQQQLETSGKKQNRRKPSSPMSSFALPNQPSASVSAASLLSLRPPSELFAKTDQKSRESPIPRRTGSKSPHRQQFNQHHHHQQQQQQLLASVKQEEAESDLIKAQLMQLQLAQAALLSGAVASSAASSNGSGFPGLGGPGLTGLAGAGNPLLYYGYYAQMLQNLQSQQQKLLEQLASQKSRFLSSPSSPSTSMSPSLHHDTSKLLMASPSHHLSLITANDAKKKHSPFSSPAFSPRLSSSSPPFTSGSHFPGNLDDDTSPLGPNDEPRRRAPRALTGRYVRTGTGASPRVLQILRKKIEERLKLKELLGENSHLYFGALNKNKKNGGKKQQPQNRGSPSISVNQKFC